MLEGVEVILVLKFGLPAADGGGDDGEEDDRDQSPGKAVVVEVDTLGARVVPKSMAS